MKYLILRKLRNPAWLETGHDHRYPSGRKANAKTGASAAAGDFAASLSLSGQGSPKQMLGTTKIAGGLSSADWDITGHGAAITVKGTVSAWTLHGRTDTATFYEKGSAEPSVFHNSSPCTPSSATKYSESLTTLREKLVKIWAKVVQHARYVVFQMAEVAIPRGLFRATLERIRRLRLPAVVFR